MNTDKVLALAREACKIGGIDVTTANDQLIMGNRDIIKFAALLQREMEAENAELRKDAERYRWLADKVMARNYGDNENGGVGWIIGHCKGPKWIEGLSMDAAIDRARSLRNDT